MPVVPCPCLEANLPTPSLTHDPLPLRFEAQNMGGFARHEGPGWSLRGGWGGSQFVFIGAGRGAAALWRPDMKKGLRAGSRLLRGDNGWELWKEGSVV